jgi:hypothetical protein
MLVPFNQMPDHARLWVYVSSRNFTPEEELNVEEKLRQFVNGWETHGAAMSGSYEISNHRIIVLAADEKFLAASGCSIDKQVHLIKSIENEMNPTLLDKLWVYVQSRDGLVSHKLSALKSLIEQGMITHNSLILNNLCPTVGDWRKESFVPASNTWTKRYFPEFKV